MKLSEQLEAYTRSCNLINESPILGQWIIDDIKKLECELETANQIVHECERTNEH